MESKELFIENKYLEEVIDAYNSYKDTGYLKESGTPYINNTLVFHVIIGTKVLDVTYTCRVYGALFSSLNKL